MRAAGSPYCVYRIARQVKHQLAVAPFSLLLPPSLVVRTPPFPLPRLLHHPFGASMGVAQSIGALDLPLMLNMRYERTCDELTEEQCAWSGERWRNW